MLQRGAGSRKLHRHAPQISWLVSLLALFVACPSRDILVGMQQSRKKEEKRKSQVRTKQPCKMEWPQAFSYGQRPVDQNSKKEKEVGFRTQGPQQRRPTTKPKFFPAGETSSNKNTVSIQISLFIPYSTLNHSSFKKKNLFWFSPKKSNLFWTLD